MELLPTEPVSPTPIVAIVPRSRTLPLSPGRIAWQTTVDRETHALFEELKALLAHVVPTGDMASVLKRALQVAVEQEKKRKFASGVKCRSQRSEATTRAIPDAIKQQVFARDGAACTFVGADGKRCGSTWRLELDHVLPVALGGETSVENLRVLCRAHNQFESERVLGEAHAATAT
ncbi:MAG: HNH endonuclease [Candidatus Eisenbacteria bacterium]|uniref:HNH endonuclease n=2 Tax=Eiseniibacteriota bacterium TaxID=2212470 RepID=A0A933SD62_UNCEI|nr:HNH endonuclease [Candidatus Eisenbacteria bacterium]